jgi:hypothetical protein
MDQWAKYRKALFASVLLLLFASMDVALGSIDSMKLGAHYD